MFGGVSWLASSKGSENKTASTPVSSLLYYRRPSPTGSGSLVCLNTHTHTHWHDFFFLTHTRELVGYSRFLASRPSPYCLVKQFFIRLESSPLSIFSFSLTVYRRWSEYFGCLLTVWFISCTRFSWYFRPFFSLYTRDEWPLDSRYRTTSITFIRVWNK